MWREEPLSSTGNLKKSFPQPGDGAKSFGFANSVFKVFARYRNRNLLFGFVLLLICITQAYAKLELDVIRLKLPLKSPKIVVHKARRELLLYSDGNLLRTYRIALGSSPIGEKERQGDRRTPEGRFYLSGKNPKSAYSLSLVISYPNRQEAVVGLKTGLISKQQYLEILRANRLKRTPLQHTRLGGDIMIHGGGVSEDWTWGCVALSNADIKELYRVAPTGTEILITP